MTDNQITVFFFESTDENSKLPSMIVCRTEGEIALVQSTMIDSENVFVLLKRVDGTLPATRQQTADYIRTMTAKHADNWLDGTLNNDKDLVLEVCETIVNLHRYTNDKNQSLRGKFRKYNNEWEFLNCYRLAFHLLAELPETVFSTADTLIGE